MEAFVDLAHHSQPVDRNTGELSNLFDELSGKMLTCEHVVRLGNTHVHDKNQRQPQNDSKESFTVKYSVFLFPFY